VSVGDDIDIPAVSQVFDSLFLLRCRWYCRIIRLWGYRQSSIYSTITHDVYVYL